MVDDRITAKAEASFGVDRRQCIFKVAKAVVGSAATAATLYGQETRARSAKHLSPSGSVPNPEETARVERIGGVKDVRADGGHVGPAVRQIG